MEWPEVLHRVRCCAVVEEPTLCCGAYRMCSVAQVRCADVQPDLHRAGRVAAGHFGSGCERQERSAIPTTVWKWSGAYDCVALLACSTAVAYPSTRQAGAKLNNGVFWGNWVISAIVDAMFIYFFVWFANQWGDAETGDSPSVFELGVICFTAVVCVTNVRVAIETHCHYPFFQFVVIMSGETCVRSRRGDPHKAHMCTYNRGNRQCSRGGLWRTSSTC